jgi:hypothetical protein
MGPLLTWWNLGIWGSWIALGFGVREILALTWDDCPWDTFSRFTWDIQARWDFATVIVVAVLGILASHLIRFKSIREGDRLPVKEQIRRRKVAHAHHVIAKNTEVHHAAKT